MNHDRLAWPCAPYSRTTREDTCSLSLSLSLSLSAVAHASSFTESFGDVTQSSCDAPWYVDCEVGWETASGHNNTIEVCSEADAPASFGVRIRPTGAMHSGFGQAVVLDPGDDEIELRAEVHVLANASEVGLRLVFKDASGVTVDTSAAAWTLDVGVHDVTLATAAKANAATVELQIVGLTDLTDFWVDSVSYTAASATQGECDARAEAWRMQAYNECYGRTGTPTGDCIGKPDNTYAGGCKIECTLSCLGLPAETNPEPVQYQCVYGQ